MQTAINRTFICSVVFLDMVEYSKKPVAEQIFFKERLNTLLTEALTNVAPNDRIILDTGDGAALSFLGDPEDALYVSLALREALEGPQPPGPELKMRLGINLGPVRLVKDINGQPNIIGDGINVAQRVMSFSEPGQIMVSRSFYEVVSCLSEGYGRLFTMKARARTSTCASTRSTPCRRPAPRCSAPRPRIPSTRSLQEAARSYWTSCRRPRWWSPTTCAASRGSAPRLPWSPSSALPWDCA